MKFWKNSQSLERRNELMETWNLGFGLISFCQTWGSEGPTLACSPHFQTRIYIKDAIKFKNWYTTLKVLLGGNKKRSNDISSSPFINPHLVTGYANNMNALINSFKSEGYENKFVNLDALWQNIKNTPSTIDAFLNGAPDRQAFLALKDAHKKAKVIHLTFSSELLKNTLTQRNLKTYLQTFALR